MALLQDVRGLFRRLQKPVELDLDESQARRLVNRDTRPDLLTNGTVTEAKPIRLKPAEEQNRVRREILTQVESIASLINAQSHRLKDLTETTQQFPAGLDVLPEIGRQNASLLEAMQEHLTRARRHDEGMADAVERLGDLASRHQDLLGLMHQQLESGRDTSERLRTTLDELHQVIAELTQVHARSAEALVRVAEASRQREKSLEETIGRAAAWLIGLTITVSATAIGGFIVAMWMALR